MAPLEEASISLERYTFRAMLVVLGAFGWVGVPFMCAYEGALRDAWAQTVDFYRWLGEEWRGI